MESMNSLIAITEKEVGARYEQCVDGRDLHGFLEVGRFFPNWIKGRIEDYGFQEDVDFATYSAINHRNQEDGFIANFGNKSEEVFSEMGKNPDIGGRPYTEYSLTLDMAKELCMIERNEKCRQARKYFIECEKRLKDITTAESQLEAGTFTTGLRTGIILSRVLERNGFDMADAARLVWYRNAELTQAEAAKLFDVSREKIQEIEKTLKDVGIEFPVIKANKRAKEMRDRLDTMLGFRDRGLRLVEGGAL